MTSTISGLRAEMKSGIKNYYSNRGISDLYAYQMRLLNELRQAKAAGHDLKASLQWAQRDVLRCGSYSTTPIMDDTFRIIDSKSIPADFLNLGRSVLADGGLVFEGHYAGLGTRLESPKPKFNMTLSDLLDGLEVFNSRTHDPKYAGDPIYQTLASQIKQAGGLDGLKAEYSGISDASLGDMIIIGKAYAVYQAAREMGRSVDDALTAVKNLRFKIIVNQDSGEKIINSFLSNNFYGIEAENILFMAQAKHPVLEVSRSGELVEDLTRSSQGNHGLIPFQSFLDEQWFHFSRHNGSSEEKHLSGVDFSLWLKSQSVELVGSIEDTAQLLSPINTGYVGLVRGLGQQNDISFFMKMVGQKKDNPQKGGFLASVNGKNVVLETDTTPDIRNEEIEFLNENKNAIFNPIRALSQIVQGDMINNLHPTFILHGWAEDGSPILRIEPKVPQGDRNLYLNSMYLQILPKVEIANLKDPVDIRWTMEMMKQFLSNPDNVDFSRNALGINLLR